MLEYKRDKSKRQKYEKQLITEYLAYNKTTKVKAKEKPKIRSSKPVKQDHTTTVHVIRFKSRRVS